MFEFSKSNNNMSKKKVNGTHLEGRVRTNLKCYVIRRCMFTHL